MADTFSSVGHAFVPRPVEGARFHRLPDGGIVIGEARATIDALDPLGSLVWQCCDGTVNLEDLGQELAEAFEAPVDQVVDDVIGLARTFGARGLLEGVEPAQGPAATSPTGLQPGDAMEPFALPDSAGQLARIGQGGARRTLLVNWSRSCGYCLEIAPLLVAAQAELADRGVDLLLLSSEDVTQQHEVLDDAGASPLPVVTRPSADATFEDPFAGMGTPAAYLVDGTGQVVAPLAYGAPEVSGLVRATAAGGERPQDDAARYLPGPAGGACGPGANTRRRSQAWRPTRAFTVGSYTVGIRTDDELAEALVARLLAAHAAPDDPLVPVNYSVVLPAARGSVRELNLLQARSEVVVRSRSARRVLRALAARLSAVLASSEGSEREATATGVPLLASGIVGPQGAYLLPRLPEKLAQRLEPRLSRLGMRLVDEPHVVLDLTTAELVVPQPLVTLDLSALEAVEEGGPWRTELRPAEAGRYPLARWLLAGAGGSPSRAEIVARLLGTAMIQPEELHELVGWFDDLAGRVPVVPTASGRPGDLTEQLAQMTASRELAGSRPAV